MSSIIFFKNANLSNYFCHFVRCVRNKQTNKQQHKKLRIQQNLFSPLCLTGENPPEISYLKLYGYVMLSYLI